jgi:hypothetical protein
MDQFALSESQKEQNVGLVDVLDRAIEKGIVVHGDVAVSLANIDLIFVGLRLIVTSASKAASLNDGPQLATSKKLSTKDKEYISKLERAIKNAEREIPKALKSRDPKDIEKNLAKLVITITELLRRVMEREALRQVQNGVIGAVDRRKLGLALKALAKKMELIRATFGLDEEDINMDLGPLGKMF